MTLTMSATEGESLDTDGLCSLLDDLDRQIAAGYDCVGLAPADAIALLSVLRPYVQEVRDGLHLAELRTAALLRSARLIEAGDDDHR